MQAAAAAASSSPDPDPDCWRAPVRRRGPCWCSHRRHRQRDDRGEIAVPETRSPAPQNAALELKPPARLIAVANDRRGGAGRSQRTNPWRGVAWIRVLCCHIPPTCSSATSVQCEYAPGLAIRGHMRGRSCARHGQLKARPPCARRPGRDRIKSLANEPQPRLVARACVFCAKPRGDSGIDWSRASFKRPAATPTHHYYYHRSGSDAPLLLWH